VEVGLHLFVVRAVDFQSVYQILAVLGTVHEILKEWFPKRQDTTYFFSDLLLGFDFGISNDLIHDRGSHSFDTLLVSSVF
jgi:hypothetical protein